MPLAVPKFVVLDSSTLGKISRDYWCQDRTRREKAQRFVNRLTERGIYLAFRHTHILELLQHNSDEIVRDRLRFLRGIPLIAWLRPYDRSWFPGSLPDLLTRELHAFVHCSAPNWRDIVADVRPDLWETGVGSEMFVENDQLWSAVRAEAMDQHERDKKIASLSRTDAGGINHLKIRELLGIPNRPKNERTAYMQGFAREMKRQMERHGDKRFKASGNAAVVFAKARLKDIEDIEATGGDTILRLLESRNIPLELVDLEMTVDDIGELAIYERQLKLVADKLEPHAKLTMRDVPPETLPSYVIERRLRSIQQKAERISGSNFGDGHIAPLVLYADAVEVDKRTFEFLNQIRRADTKFDSLVGRYFRSGDYTEIPERLS